APKDQEVRNHNVDVGVVVETGEQHVRGTAPGGVIGAGGEVVGPVVEQNGHAASVGISRILIGHDDVRKTIIVHVANRQGVGLHAHGVKYEGLERAVAVAHEHADVVGSVVGHHDVG